MGIQQSTGQGRRWFLTSVGSVVVTGMVAGCTEARDGERDQANVIDMTDELEFVPTEFEAVVGGTVTWKNVGSVEHSVTAYEDDIPEDATYFASGGFDNESAARNAWPDGSIAGDETYEHTFDTAGDYKYFCFPHESAGMVGTITIR